jgi:hypothetical protein
LLCQKGEIVKNVLLIAIAAISLVSCSPALQSLSRPTVRFTALKIITHKDCDELLAGQGEFAFKVTVNGQTLAERGVSNAVGLSDGQALQLNLVKQINLNYEQEINLTVFVAEIDTLDSITVINASKTYNSLNNFGINSSDTIWSIRNAPTSVCDVEFQYKIERI